MIFCAKNHKLQTYCAIFGRQTVTMVKRNYFFLFIAGFISGGFLLTSCENDINEVRALTKKTTAMEQGKEIVTYYSQSGKIRAKLTSPIMNRYDIDTAYIEFPKTLHVDFYNDSLVVESKLDARYGKYKENENKVFLKDSVRIINNVGDTLFCKELWWDQRQEKFYTDKYVEVHEKRNIIKGLSGMEATQDLKSKTFFNSTGTVMVANDSLP